MTIDTRKPKKTNLGLLEIHLQAVIAGRPDLDWDGILRTVPDKDRGPAVEILDRLLEEEGDR